jgi:hypothetical protein
MFWRFTGIVCSRCWWKLANVASVHLTREWRGVLS